MRPIQALHTYIWIPYICFLASFGCDYALCPLHIPFGMLQACRPTSLPVENHYSGQSKSWAQTLNPFNRLLHISIGKSSIVGNLLQVYRLNQHCRKCFNQINGLVFAVFIFLRSNGKERSSFRSRLRGLASWIHT